MKVTGKMMSVMEKEYLNILTEINMRVTGQMISSMGRVLIFSIREIVTKALISWVNVRVREFTIMLTVISM